MRVEAGRAKTGEMLGTGGHPGDEVIRECADILAQKKGWSPERKQMEIDEVNARFPDFG